MIITYLLLKKYGYYDRIVKSAHDMPIDKRLVYIFFACNTAAILLLIPLIIAA